MVQEPNLDTFVVCRAKDDIGLVQIGEVNPYICLRVDGCRRTSLCCTYFMVDRFCVCSIPRIKWAQLCSVVVSLVRRIRCPLCGGRHDGAWFCVFGVLSKRCFVVFSVMRVLPW